MNEIKLDGAAKTLFGKIESKKARVGVMGLGYVGLPLVLEVARAGFTAVGFDPDKRKLQALAKSKTYIEDVSDDEIAQVQEDHDFTATADFSELADMDAVIICVPTPLSKTKDPDMSYIDSAVGAVHKTLRKGQLVVLESTTYPGTTDEVALPKLESTGLSLDRDFFLAFSPERVDPKNPKFKVKNTPKVVGGLTPASTKLAAALYGAFVDTVVPVSSAKAAEMTKLLENTFRMVNIGLINEIAIMCEKLGIDVWEVIDAASTKPFGYMPFYPGPGLGGHCIPVDPLYLGWKLKTLNYRARFVDLADHVNSTMPNYVVFRAAKVLNDDSKCVRGSSVLVLGAAYKPGVSDMRESPSLPVIQQLAGLGARVSYHDPWVPRVDFDGHGFAAAGHFPSMESVPLTKERLAEQDLVVVATAHENVDYALVQKHSRRILDTRNALKAFKGAKNLVRL